MMRYCLSIFTLSSLLVWTASAEALQPPETSAPPAEQPAEPADDQDPAVTGEPEAAPSAETGSAAAAFAEQFQKWQTKLEQLRALQTRYQVADADEAARIRQQWEQTIQQTEQLIPDLRAAARQAYLEAPNQDRQLTRFIAKIIDDAMTRDQSEVAYELSVPLIEHEAGIKQLYTAAGISAFALHKFDEAEKYLTQAQQQGVLSETGQNMLDQVADYQKYWAEEQKVREQEAALEGDRQLPRVRLVTSKGDIIVELFEEQAPETVGNFVNLVESGFYDGVPFHRVLPSFMAQTGDPTGQSTGGPGYNIYDEYDNPDARMHFRGSLSMANTGRPNTGGSQFFITFLPTPHLNNRHTVFGRVIEGMDVLEDIQRRDPAQEGQLPEPDQVVKAEVLHKRPHEYVPRKVQ